MFRRFFPHLCLFLATGVSLCHAATLTCVPSTIPAIVHGEGITERTGDIVFTCTGGTPEATITANLFFFLNVAITNRLSPGPSGTFTGHYTHSRQRRWSATNYRTSHAGRKRLFSL